MLTNPRDAFSSHSRSPNIAPFHMLGIVSSCAIVTLSLRDAVFTIFDFKKCHDLDIGVRGLSKSLKVAPFERFVWFPITVFSNIIPKTHSFWDIQLQNCRDLENRVKGPSSSLQMSPCDRAHMTSYWRSIVTMVLSRTVSEIFNVEKCRDLEIGVKCHSRSLRVVLFHRLCCAWFSISVL